VKHLASKYAFTWVNLYRYAVEMCVPTATTELTMWMHVYSSSAGTDE
jgi:hypothetical protein